MSGLLQDKVVVLSGVGPGLGRSLGQVCAAQGAHLVLASRTERRLEKAAAAVAELGRRALAVPTDITDPAACQALVDATLSEFGRVDVLVNNAFAIPPMEPLTTLAEDALRTSNETNVLAPLRLTGLFADALAATGGSVVMVNSAVIHHSRVEFGGYKLAKGALLHMASSLATELGPRGIRVNTVAPGWIYENVQKAYFDWLAAERGVTHQDVYDEIAATTDLLRLPLPEEVANAVVFLASDLASGVTGQCLDVNCGEFHN
jgi:NAD(P)-dependent dehydrogenase (short-subunit alcohol dehydrogenase family)